MIALLATIFLQVCSGNTNPASCSVTNDCCFGFSCVAGTCAAPNQAIAACRCKNGQAPVCECYRNGTNGTRVPVNCAQVEGADGSLAGDGIWKDCQCEGGFEASLRLVFRWEPADRVHYRFAVTTQGQLSIPNTNITDSDTNGPIRTALRNAMAQWSERDCGGGKKALLKITQRSPDLITPSEVTQLFAFSGNSNPISCTSFNSSTGVCNGAAVLGLDDVKNVVGFLGSRDAPDAPGIFPVSSGASKSGVLAATPIHYSRSRDNPGDTSSPRKQTGRILQARTWFNALDYRWRTLSNGCTAGSADCFDLMTIAVHEFGHYVGYQHSSCGASVMYGTADKSTVKRQLEAADVESLCGRSDCIQTAGYPTLGTTGLPPYKNKAGQTLTIPGTRSRLQSCTTDAECGGDPKFKCINKEYAGFCQFTCTTDVDCPSGEACVSIRCDAGSTQCLDPQKGTAYRYCAISTSVAQCQLPGASGTGGGSSGGGSGGTAGSTGGTTGGGGTSGGTTGSTTGGTVGGGAGLLRDFCAPCNGPGDCLNGICLSASNNTRVCSLQCYDDTDCGENGLCSIAEGATQGYCYPKNTACIDQQVSARRQLNEACDNESLCAPGLVCLQLVNSAVCLEYCSPNGSVTCSTDGFGCVKIDNRNDVGVCFKANMKEGDSCIIPDTSLCGDPRSMLCAGTPEKNYLDAQCYKLCGAEFGDCKGSGQSCSLYPNLDIGVCTPPVKPTCLADIGQACGSTDECASGSCVQRGGESACSRTCSLSLQSGCPRGNRCIDDGDGNDKGFCWPEDDKVKAPAKCESGKSGCSCHETSAEEAWIAGVVAVALAARRRSKRWWRRAGWLACLAAVAAPISAQATVAIALDGPELAAVSDVIVHARVMKVSGHVDSSTNRVFTDALLEVVLPLKGSTVGTTLAVTYPGGEVNGLGMMVSGQIKLHENKEYVLYLSRISSGELIPAAMRQGFYEVVLRDYDGVRMAHRSMQGLSLVKRAKGSGLTQVVSTPTPLQVPLQTLVADIKRDLSAAAKLDRTQLIGIPR